MDARSRVSKTVQREIETFYAKLASAAAKKAVNKVDNDDLPGAIKWSGQVEVWLKRAGAEKANWAFRQPNV